MLNVDELEIIEIKKEIIIVSDFKIIIRMITIMNTGNKVCIYNLC